MKFALPALWLLLALYGLKASANAEVRTDAIISLALTPSEQSRQTATFKLRHEQLQISGSVTIDIPTDRIRFHGRYSTSQDIDPNSYLAFNAHGVDGGLRLLDGARTVWEIDGDELIAQFDYSYYLSEIGMESLDTTIEIRFNYVLEGEYWYSDRFPDMVLPRLRLSGIERDEEFELLTSWIPRFAPQNLAIHPMIRFRTYKNADGPFRHRLSMEVFNNPDADSRVEQRRHSLAAKENGKVHLHFPPVTFKEPSQYFLRPGFVWEGVKWYKSSPHAPLRPIRAIPIWLYTIVAFACGAALLGALEMTLKVRSRTIRWTTYFGLTIAFVAYGLEFASALLPPTAAALAAAVTATRRIARPYANYWTLLLTFIFLELFWSVALPATNIKPHGIALSLSIAALGLTPMVRIHSRIAGFLYAATLIVLANLYFYFLRFYFGFFQDYPSINALTYSEQGADLGDSILAIAESSFAFPALASIWCIGACLLIAARRPSALCGRIPN